MQCTSSTEEVTLDEDDPDPMAGVLVKEGHWDTDADTCKGERASGHRGRDHSVAPGATGCWGLPAVPEPATDQGRASQGRRRDCGLSLQTCGPRPERVIAVVLSLRIVVRVMSAPGSPTPSVARPQVTGVCPRLNRRKRADFVFLFFTSFPFQCTLCFNAILNSGSFKPESES